MEPPLLPIQRLIALYASLLRGIGTQQSMQSDWEQASKMSEEKEHVLQSFRAYSVEEDE